MIYIIIILVYLVIAALAYKYVVGDHPVWEKVMMSIGWPLLIPLYLVYWIHKNL